MLLTPRQDEIVALAKANGRVLVDELASRFSVTPQTIRKDLNDLCDTRVLTRIHGGALFPSGNENVKYEARRAIASVEKQAIGAAAAALIPNNSSLFINIGTTTEAVGEALADHHELMVITNNINVANRLRVFPGIEVVIAGGVVRGSDGGIVGEAAVDFIRQFKVDFAVIGRTTDTGRLIVRHKGDVEADLPVDKLANSAPLYQRPWLPTDPPKTILAEWVPAASSLTGTLEAMMSGPHLASRRWIYEQYDHMVMGQTIGRPGGDAAVVRLPGTKKAIAASCDVTPRYCLADPVMGTKQAVVETWRNLTAVGADPIAITDNMNFGNPERPEIMGQFVGSVEGMGEACRALGYPVVSGNVSLYNETNGKGIPPTPAIGGVGLVPDWTKTADIKLKHDGHLLILIG
ncbi:MAG: DeoR family transcriptional regulator, partial [Hyphomicrobium sp.]|nr:DeoR family transcriptional regulator [Hyphomicrobium sp.]